MHKHNINNCKPIFTLVFILLAVTLTACSTILLPTQPQPTESVSTVVEEQPTAISATSTVVPASGTVSIWHSWQNGQVTALLDQIAKFQNEYPNVQFDVTYIPSVDLRASYEQAALNGKAPSLLIGPAEWGPGLYDQRLIADISPLVSEELMDSLNQAALEASSYQHGLIGLPLHIMGNVLYRNRSIIPSTPVTYEELVSLSTSATKGETFGALFDRSLFFSGGHLQGLGGQLMQSDGSPAFNDEKGHAWVQLLQEFERAGPVEYGADNDLQLFMENRLGMMIESSRRSKDLSEAIGAENLAIDQWPIYGDGALSGFVQSENMFLNPQALKEDQMVTWKFVQSFLTPEAQTGLADVSLIPALLPERIVSGGNASQIDDSLIVQAMQALAGGAAYPTRPEMAVYYPYLEIALQSIFSGEASPQDALGQAAEAIQAELAARQLSSTPIP